MQLKPVIKTQQKQSLIITPQLQQAIKLLQMTNLEIQAFLDEQALENPFLEVSTAKANDDDHSALPEAAAPQEQPTQDTPQDVAEMTPSNNALQDDPTEHADMDNRYSSLESPSQLSHYDTDGEDIMARLVNPEPGLHAMILRQIDLAIIIAIR